MKRTVRIILSILLRRPPPHTTLVSPLQPANPAPDASGTTIPPRFGAGSTLGPDSNGYSRGSIGSAGQRSWFALFGNEVQFNGIIAELDADTDQQSNVISSGFAFWGPGECEECAQTISRDGQIRVDRLITDNTSFLVDENLESAVFSFGHNSTFGPRIEVTLEVR